MQYKQQSGYAILVSAVTLLFVMTLLIFTTSNTVITEQLVINNQVSAQNTFEAAQAGLDMGSIHLNQHRSSILKDTSGNGHIDTYSNSEITQVKQQNGTRYNVSYANPVPNNLGLIEVTSTGISADGSINRSIREQYINASLISSIAKAPMISHKKVTLSGNMKITNTYNPTTVWSGGDITLKGNASTDIGNGNGSDRKNQEPDLSPNDTNISTLTPDEFFIAMTGKDKKTVKDEVDIIYTNTSSTNYSSLLNGVKGKSIWIQQSSGEARFNSNITIGSSAEPVVLFVNGDAKMSGNVEIYGVVYIAHDFINKGGGTLTVHGSFIVEGEVDVTGTPNIYYDPDTLIKVQQQIGKLVRIPGSWHDI